MKNIFKKIIAFTILITLVICPINIADGEENPIKVIIDGKELVFDVEPMIENGRLLVPLRSIFEALDAEITWDGSTQTVTAIKENKTIILTIDKDIALVNDKECKLDVPAKIVSGRTLVPVRFVSESLGENVEWNGNTRTVFITTFNNNRGNSIGNISNYGFVVENDDYIFYNYNNNQIIKMNKENNEKDVIFEAESIDSLNLIDDKLFCSIYNYEDESDEGIYVLNINDNEVQKLSDDFAWDINIVDNYIYYLNDSDDCTIYKMNLDGSEKQKIHSYSFYSLVVEGDWMYVVNSDDDYKLYKLKIDGTELIKLDDKQSDCNCINISGEWIYYISDSEDGIFRIKKDGTEQQQLFSDYVSCLNIYNDYIFFLYEDCNYKSYLCRMDKDGENLTVLDSTISNCDINLNNSTVYCIAYHPYLDYDQDLAGLYCIDFDGNIKQKLEIGNKFDFEFINGDKTKEYDVLTTKDINNPLISIDKFRKLLDLKSSTVKYDEDSKEITIKGDNVLKMKLDSSIAFLNDEVIHLSDIPILFDDDIYIPLKIAVKAFNIDIQYDIITDTYFIIDNEDFPKVKEILESSITNMSKIDKFRTAIAINYILDSNEFEFDVITVVADIEQDNKEEMALMDYSLAAKIDNGGVSTDRKSTFYYKGNSFVKYYPSEIWLEAGISSYEWNSFFIPPTPIDIDYIVYFNNLKIIEQEDGFISLEGKIESDNYEYLFNETMISEDMNFTVESFDVALLIEKETKYIYSTIIKIECDLEGEKIEIEMIREYSDFNEDFIINIPENFTIE